MGCGNKTDGAAPDQTRPSCLDCVEKHLGAALVLLSELREGYRYRLLIIGHLHEAAEESQAWPDISRHIRAARRRFQASGAVPDFAAIGKMIEDSRAKTRKPPAEPPRVPLTPEVEP